MAATHLPQPTAVCLQASLSADDFFYAWPFWTLAMWGASTVGCLLLRMYAPRIDGRYVGHIE